MYFAILRITNAFCYLVLYRLERFFGEPEAKFVIVLFPFS